ncbi:MAG: hypothetical protein IKP95_07265 [Ruminococcus sp.]|nr:hypothetical protein [Ruminococcus sp.]
MKFKEFRKYISKIDRLSICMKETLRYENYQFISEVPEKFDEYYLFGIGRIQSEFPVKQAFDEALKRGMEITDENSDSIIYAECLEIMLSETPRDDEE